MYAMNLEHERNMTIRAATRTLMGTARVRNEDYIWTDTAAGVCIVADGIGGRARGDLASRLAAETIGQRIAAWVRHNPNCTAPAAVRAMLIDTIELANRRILTIARSKIGSPGMGATVVVALVQASTAYIVHAGDARAYLAREEQLLRLTRDDTLVEQMVAAGELTEAEAHYHPHGHLLTRALGQEKPVAPQVAQVALLPNDRLLLCSDGLWAPLGDHLIRKVLRQTRGDLEQTAALLVAAARHTGGMDDVSAAVVTPDT